MHFHVTLRAAALVKSAAVRVSETEIDRALANAVADELRGGEAEAAMREVIAHHLAREHAARRWYGPRGRWRPVRPSEPNVGEVCVSSMGAADEHGTVVSTLEAVTPRAILHVTRGWL